MVPQKHQNVSDSWSNTDHCHNKVSNSHERTAPAAASTSVSAAAGTIRCHSFGKKKHTYVSTR